MAYQSIQLTKERGVSHIMLNRPQVLNAISEEMRVELSEALGALESDPEARVLVISGSGKAFSAGADLRHFKFLYEEFSRSGLKTPFGGPELAQIFFRFPKPTIAAVNGAAVGWGMTVSLACDIRIASTQAKFLRAFRSSGSDPGVRKHLPSPAAHRVRPSRGTLAHRSDDTSGRSPEHRLGKPRGAAR